MHTNYFIHNLPIFTDWKKYQKQNNEIIKSDDSIFAVKETLYRLNCSVKV